MHTVSRFQFSIHMFTMENLIITTGKRYIAIKYALNAFLLCFATETGYKTRPLIDKSKREQQEQKIREINPKIR